MDHKRTTQSEKFTVLITGANRYSVHLTKVDARRIALTIDSGLGYASCCRIIDEFLETRPVHQSIHLIFSTRSQIKRSETLHRLNKYFKSRLSIGDGGTNSVALSGGRVVVEGVLVDLTRLTTVKQLAQDLVRRGQRIDAVILNAGIGGWKSGWAAINWLSATYTILTQFKDATTFPKYMACNVGNVTGRQLKASSTESSEAEPLLGEVFTANVFGHYMLVHWLAPLFNADSRIVWVSSLSAQHRFFEPSDLQHIKTSEAYESSKRMTDLLVLTSELPSTRSYVANYLPTSSVESITSGATSSQAASRPTMYVTHPGVVFTAIAGMPYILSFAIRAAFWLARFLGSPWHTIIAYQGAVSAVWVCLASREHIQDRELQEGKGKWGSVVDGNGTEGVKRTEVHGWHFCGVPGRIPAGSVSGTAGRDRDRLQQTPETRVQFEEEGILVWKELEEMRLIWEERLKDA